MARICVYLGSREGNSPAFRQATNQLGRTLAERGHTLVYGGARVGLMGELANAALEAGGEVIGVMPDHLVEREQAHFGLSELIRVQHARTQSHDGGQRRCFYCLTRRDWHLGRAV